VLVQKFHIQEQGQIFVECKSSSTLSHSLIISPNPLQRSKENPPGASVVSRSNTMFFFHDHTAVPYTAVHTIRCIKLTLATQSIRE